MSLASGVLILLLGPLAAVAADDEAPAVAADDEASTSSAATEIPATLRVTVEPSIEDAAQFPQLIAQYSAAALGEVPTRARGEAQWVHVELAGTTYDYRISVTAVRGDQVLSDPTPPIACKCTSEEAKKTIDQEIRRVLGDFARETPREEDRGDSADDNGESEPSDYVSLNRVRRGTCRATAEGYQRGAGEPEGMVPVRVVAERCITVPLGAMGKAGIALTAAGGAGVIAGAVMAAVGEVSVPGVRVIRGRDWRNPTGFIVLGVGAGSLATGLSLLVLDRRRCRRDPARCERSAAAMPAMTADETSHRRRKHGLTWSPWFGSRGSGLAVSGRF